MVKKDSWEGRTVTVVRVFKAPRSLVFACWVDPKRLAEWWGPKGFTNPVCEVDARPGGKLRIEMQAPNGVRYPVTGEYSEVHEPERLVYVSSALEPSGRKVFDIENVIVFEEEGGATRVTMTGVIRNVTPDAGPYLEGMNEGWNQSLERLTTYLSRQ